MSASDCIHDNPLQEDVAEDSLSCKFIEALQQAIVGQTLGPISSSICQIATETIAVSDEKSKTLDPERSTTSLKVILQGNNGEEESVSFIPAVDEDDAHLVIQKTGRGVYVKLMRRFETPSEIRGLVIDGQLKKDTAEVVVIKEEEEVDEGLVEHPPSSNTSHIDEEHILNVTKKCPNCSVCFRNTSNLLAHQTYYCTGRDHKEQAAPSPRDHHVSSKSLSVSQSSSPRLTSRSSSRNSSGSDEGSGSAQSVHVCQLCQSSFMSRQNCESHMLILHCGEHVPMCKFCNFVAGSWDILRDHVFTHVKVEKREEAQSSNGDRSVVGCNGCARLTEIGESDGVVGGDDSSRDNSQGRSNTKHFHVKHDSNSMNDNCNSNDSRETDDVHRTRGLLEKSNLKRKCSSSREFSKRTRWGDATGRGSPLEVRNVNYGNPSPPAISASMCRACNISFRSKENYVAHKKYYCKQRHSEHHESKVMSPSSDSREGSPRRCQSPGGMLPNVVHSKNQRGSPMQYTVERNVSPERSDRSLMKGPPHAPLVYMSQVVPSAMLVGGTQIISPNGAHLISPIFLLTPPVAIPVTGVEPSLPTSTSDSSWKRKDKVDSPLDLSMTSSPATPENVQRPSEIREEEEDCDNLKVQSPRSPSSASPQKSFICGQCGVSFWKANTLIAHKQLYCSEMQKDESKPSSGRPSQRQRQTSPGGSDSSELPSQDPRTRFGAAVSTSETEQRKRRLPFPASRVSPNRSRHEQHLEKYFTSFHIENQIYKGLHLCSGCGVAFRKLESLEIHQKFYCQKSASSAPGSSGTPSTTAERNCRGTKDKNSQSENNHLRLLSDGNVIHTRKGNTKSRHLPVNSGLGKHHKPDEFESRSRDETIGKERSGRQSLELCDRQMSPNQDINRRARSWPMISQREVDDDESRKSPPAFVVGDGTSDKIKSEQNDFLDKDRTSQGFGRVNEKNVNGCIRVKTEASSPKDDGGIRPGRDHQKTENARAQVHRKIPHSVSVVGVRPDSTFLPSSKACRACNISFHSLSTFIAHKKYYCSSTASQRSKLST
ncbi:uncharacterized protein [Apostichopus japonicus]